MTFDDATLDFIAVWAAFLVILVCGWNLAARGRRRDDDDPWI